MNQLTRTSAPAISVQNLRKVYVVHERESGLRAAVKSLFNRQFKEILAVDDISFELAPGEVVGFLGPNGAGKTTTIKMLTGLLYVSGGKLSVLGFDPFRRQNEFLSQMTLIMGQRNQLHWDIPAIESFQYYRALYGVPEANYRRVLDELADLLDLGSLLYKPVRTLSLGERMRCELAGALLHTPKVLFLDEPTIGLDVVAQARLRSFITEYNRKHEATILLTSHYVADVEALCRRVIFIHQGKLIYDGELIKLVERFLPHKTIAVSLDDPSIDLSPYGEVLSSAEGQTILRVSKADTAQVTARILSNLPVKDLTISDPPIAEVIEHIFENKYVLAEETV
jgi:ABC-2 type transport system ATP-binding protein